MKKKIVKPQGSKKNLSEKKKENKKNSFFYLKVLIILLIFGSVFCLNRFYNQQKTPTDEVFDAYLLANQVEKHRLEVLLIDIRPRNEYQKEHIPQAVNIPALSALDKYEDGVKWNLKEVKKIIAEQKKEKKTLVIYGYNKDSFLTREAVSQLRKAGYQAAALSVGWTEWRYFTNFWIPESAWDKVNPEMLFESSKLN